MTDLKAKIEALKIRGVTAIDLSWNLALDRVLDLIATPAAEHAPVAVLQYARGTPGRENDMPSVVSCNWMPDGDYPVYLAPTGNTALVEAAKALARLETLDEFAMWADAAEHHDAAESARQMKKWLTTGRAALSQPAAEPAPVGHSDEYLRGYEQGWDDSKGPHSAAPTDNTALVEALTHALSMLQGEPEYHDQGMGCGLEDRCITDRYEAMLYGWDKAMERVYGEHINGARDVIETALDQQSTPTTGEPHDHE